nr:PQQ-dependent sugar dehydrogenase [Nitrosopumilus sp.]
MIKSFNLQIIILSLFAFTCASSKDNHAKQDATSNISVTPEIVASGLEVPWGLDFLPDGRLIFTERPGGISIINLNTKEKKLLTTRSIRDRAEGGLLGLAVDPQFNETGYIFIYETIDEGNQIVRLILKNDVLTEDKILLKGMPHAQFHDGGILRFGPDGYLYAGTGDARDPESAQDTKIYSGKILKMDKDGNAAPDNPFNNCVYSYGHRNVQGLAWDTEGNLY